MAKHDVLKKQLKQAAKRRAKRATASANQSTDPASSASVDNGSGDKSSQAIALDRFVAVVLDFDRSHPGLRDRDLVNALRAVQRGYAPSDKKIAELYSRLVAAKKESGLGTHAVRKALDQLAELVRSYDAGAKEPRSALNYLLSIST